MKHGIDRKLGLVLIAALLVQSVAGLWCACCAPQAKAKATSCCACELPPPGTQFLRAAHECNCHHELACTPSDPVVLRVREAAADPCSWDGAPALIEPSGTIKTQPQPVCQNAPPPESTPAAYLLFRSFRC